MGANTLPRWKDGADYGYIPVAPHSLLYVVCFRYVSGDHHRFARLVGEVWRQIPYRHRRRIAKYWKASRTVGAGDNLPIIRLSNCVRAALPDDVAFAQVEFCGKSLAVDARYFATMPDAVARWIIAHEFAHVYQWAIGDPDIVRVSQDIFIRESVEEFADEIAYCDWRFDREEYDNWVDALGKCVEG